MRIEPNANVRTANAPAEAPGHLQELREANVAVRGLSALPVADRKFTVARDPESLRFIVVVTETSTGQVLDQFPPKDILKMLTALAASEQNSGESPK